MAAKKTASLLIALILVLGVFAGMPLTALADDEPDSTPLGLSITSADSYTCTEGEGGSFKVTAKGADSIEFALDGSEPEGVSIGGTGLLTVAATVDAGEYAFDITASDTDGVAIEATQSFTLTVEAKSAPAAVVITGFKNIDYIVVDMGTAIADIPFPATLAATVEGGGDYSVTVSGWSCADYDPDVSKVYMFAPVLALKANESLKAGVIPPKVEIVVSLGIPVKPTAGGSDDDTIDVEDLTSDLTYTKWSYVALTNTITVADNVTVIGTETGATTTLTIDFGASNATVTWTATYQEASSALAGDMLVELLGAGIFEVTTGGAISSVKKGYALDSYGGNVSITVSGTGKVEALGINSAINAGTGTVTLTGGTVSATTSDAINAGGDVSISGGMISTATGNAIFTTAGNVTVSDGSISATTGRAINVAAPTSTVTVSGGEVKATGTDGIAIDAAGDVTVSGTGTVESTGDDGIAVKTNGDVTVSGTGTVKNTNTYMGDAIIADGDVKISGGSISAASQNAIVVDGDVNVTGTATVTGGTGGSAIYTKGSVKVSSGTFTINGDIYIAGNNSFGVYAYDIGSSVIVNGDISVTGDSSTGVNAETDGAIIVNGSITTTTDGSCGANANSRGTIEVNGDISVTGDDTIGAYAGNSGSSVEVTGDITATGDNSTGAFAETSGSITLTNGGITVVGDYSYGAYAFDGSSSVTVTGNITADGEEVIGVYAQDGGSSVEVTGNVTANGRMATGACATDGGSVTASGNITLTGADTFGAYVNNSTITVDGSITGAVKYIGIAVIQKTAAQKDATSIKPGYFQYSDASDPGSYVWVLDPAYRAAVSWSGLTANGTSGSVTTTELTLTFDVDPTALAASDITVTGATKGALTGTGLTRTLAISNITVANGANVTVSIATQPARFMISPTSRDVAVNVAAATNPNPKSGGSSKGGGGGGGGGGGPTTTTPTIWMGQNPAGTAAGDAKGNKQDNVHTKSSGEYGVRGNAWAKFAGLKYRHGTVTDGAVQVWLYINNPEKLTKDTMVSGYVKGLAVDSMKARFEKWFKNKVRVIHMDQTGPWGQPVQIAAKVDLTGMDTKNLYFYSYDKATKTYTRIANPAYWIDKNGYLHFTTEYAGDIIISEGPLEKK